MWNHKSKYFLMGALLSALLAFAPVNATNYVKDSDLTAETTVATGDSVILYDTSAGNTVKATIANIFASAGNIGAATIVTVGALDSGSITSGFGNIDIGTSNITSGGIWSVDVDGTGLGAAGAMTFGAGGDSGEYWDGSDYIITSSNGMVLGVVEAAEVNFMEVDTGTARIDFSDATSATALMLWNRADNSLIRVTTGANDTGGTGFRSLHIPNL